MSQSISIYKRCVETMPCQDLLITHHFTTVILNIVHSMSLKEKKSKTSLAKFKETRYVTTNCFRNHSSAGIRSLVFAQRWLMGRSLTKSVPVS